MQIITKSPKLPYEERTPQAGFESSNQVPKGLGYNLAISLFVFDAFKCISERPLGNLTKNK